MKPTDVFLAVPTRRDVYHRTIEALTALRAANPGLMTPFFAEGHLCVSDVRHQILRAFRQSTKLALLMCDDDVVPHPEVFRLVDRLDDAHPIIASPILILRPEAPTAYPNTLRRAPDGHGYIPFSADQGLHPVDMAGTGCMAVTRSVFMRPELRAPFFCAYDEDGVMTKSDDGAFCERARALGLGIFAHYDYWSDHRVTASITRVHQGYARLIPGWQKGSR